MAPMKETSLDKIIANISPNLTIQFQIILKLILLFELSNAWNWECLGAPIYTNLSKSFS
jgi:hypothetical protein